MKTQSFIYVKDCWKLKLQSNKLALTTSGYQVNMVNVISIQHQSNLPASEYD